MTGPLLVVIGDLVQDVIVSIAGPITAADDNPSRIHRRRGGSAANVAAVAATLGPTRFIGRVGADALGDALADELRGGGVDVRVQRSGRTGTVVILVDETGERTMFPDRGAAAELADIPTEWVDGAAAVHVPSYAFASKPSRKTVLDAMTTARAAGALLSVDASSAVLLRALSPTGYLDILRAVQPDLLFCNADEARLLDAVSTSFPAGVRTVRKDGPRPVQVTSPDRRAHSVTVPPLASVVDSTGAGDAFAAGYLQATLAGADSVEAARRGITTAAEFLTTPSNGRP